MIFYCVQSEFYDNGSVKAAMFESSKKVKPSNTSKNTPIADFYKDWFDNKNCAEEFLAEIKSA